MRGPRQVIVATDLYCPGCRCQNVVQIKEINVTEADSPQPIIVLGRATYECTKCEKPLEIVDHALVEARHAQS